MDASLSKPTHLEIVCICTNWMGSMLRPVPLVLRKNLWRRDILQPKLRNENVSLFPQNDVFFVFHANFSEGFHRPAEQAKWYCRTNCRLEYISFWRFQHRYTHIPGCQMDHQRRRELGRSRKRVESEDGIVTGMSRLHANCECGQQ